MKFYASSEMQALDRESIAAGVSGEVLMSRASRKLAGELIFFSDRQSRPVVVLCGPGNNGGDGYGLALYLHQQGWPVEIWMAVSQEKIQGDASLFFQRAKACGVICRPFSETGAWERAELFLPPGAWLVDALLGTGSREAPRGVLASAVHFLSACRPRHLIWSVDLPSGLDADSGQPFDETCCVKADHTLTLGGPKKGFSVDSSGTWTGSISVLDLSFDPVLLQKHELTSSPNCLSDLEAGACLPEFRRSAHKGNRGHLLLVGGSIGMTGAITLSARAALTSGCGLVTVLAPFSCAQVVDAAVPEAMVIHGKQGKFMNLASQGVNYAGYNAVAVGPGLRLNIDSVELLSRMLKECETPLILDADALNTYAEMEHEHRETRAPLWMTPHPGEMARLLKQGIHEVQQDRMASVRKAAGHFWAQVLLKGARSRMTDASGGDWLNLNGNPGMATGGCGDVLTGLLGGLIASGVAKERALPLAVYLHGRAGDLAACRKGMTGMRAGDVVDALPFVLRDLQGR